MSCAKYGSDVPEGAKFCPNCGAKMKEARGAATGAEAEQFYSERRHMTVLFSDPARSTPLSEKPDPEELRDCGPNFKPAVGCTASPRCLPSWAQQQTRAKRIAQFPSMSPQGADAMLARSEELSVR